MAGVGATEPTHLETRLRSLHQIGTRNSRVDRRRCTLRAPAGNAGADDLRSGAALDRRSARHEDVVVWLTTNDGPIPGVPVDTER